MPPTPPNPPIHVVIPTHVPRYLDLVLAGVARQTQPPASVTVTCDTDDPAIGAVIDRWGGKVATQSGVWWVRRASTGGERLCQVRNNAVRHIHKSIGVDKGRVLIIDGDMLCADDCIALHARFGAHADLVYPYRVNVDEPASRSLDAAMILSGEQRLELTPDQLGGLAKRERRYKRHLLLRRLRLAPPHKPKLLGGHFSVDLALYLRLNGFDEHYQGWGFKDDEFAYRAARIGATVAVPVSRIIAWHLYHPTRQPTGRMADLPTARRFARRTSLPLVCEHGVRDPLPQPPVSADRIA